MMTETNENHMDVTQIVLPGSQDKVKKEISQVNYNIIS